jgi:hypothetical protein
MRLVRFELLALTFNVLFLITGCKKSEDSVTPMTSGDFLNVKINGTEFKNSIMSTGSGFDNQDLCDNKKGFFMNLFDKPLSSRFTINTDIIHYRSNNDFKNSVAKQYTIGKDNYSSPNCNLAFFISLEDYSTQGKITTEILNGTHVISKIKQISSTSGSTKYQISGTFSADFRNSSKVVIPVTGSYQTSITVFN